jgi:hypothetical protein
MLTFRQLFEDWEQKRDWATDAGLSSVQFLESNVDEGLWRVVDVGASPESVARNLDRGLGRLRASGVAALPGLSLPVLLTAHQCMALAEHRRYSEQTTVGGGRYLLVRVVRGIILGKWTADEARQTTTGNDRSSGRRGGLGALQDLEEQVGWSSLRTAAESGS